MATKLQRIADLFDHEWPSKRFGLDWHTLPGRAAQLSITSPDRMGIARVLAQVVFTPKLSGQKVEGYDVGVEVRSFSGTPDQLTMQAELVSALAPVLKRMGTTALIQRGE